jgi:hypothetical protein
MKRFISTKLFLVLREASQKGIGIDTQVLENGYDEFAILLFTECAALTDKTAYYNSLVYTRAELAGLTEVSGKKCGNMFKESYQSCGISFGTVKTKSSVSRTVFTF